MSRKLLKGWVPSRHQAMQHEALQAFRHLFERPEIWSLTRHSVAKAAAIGVFCAFIPLPAQMVISGSVAVLLRANLLISVIMVWLSNPITIPPIFYFCYRVGLVVLSQPRQAAKLGYEWTLSGLMQGFGHIWQPLFIGLFIVAVVSSVLTYYGVLLFWRMSVSLSWRARKRKKK